jgi:RNAse (barnase) inhibitor barstar
MKPVYLIDGEKIHSLDDLYRALGEAINGPGGYFGSNLDALDDCLYGGFGTPEGGFVVEWQNSAASRARLIQTRTWEEREWTDFELVVEIFRSHAAKGVELVLL